MEVAAHHPLSYLCFPPTITDSELVLLVCEHAHCLGDGSLSCSMSGAVCFHCCTPYPYLTPSKHTVTSEGAQRGRMVTDQGTTPGSVSQTVRRSGSPAPSSAMRWGPFRSKFLDTFSSFLDALTSAPRASWCLTGRTRGPSTWPRRWALGDAVVLDPQTVEAESPAKAPSYSRCTKGLPKAPKHLTKVTSRSGSRQHTLHP